MREYKLKLVPANFDHINWLIIYRIFRAVKSGRTLKLIGSRTPEQLIVALLSGEDIPQKSIDTYSRMMKAAKKSYYDLLSCRNFGYPFDGGDFEGGVHHRFGTFTTERESWRKSDDGLDYKEMMKDNMDVYREERGNGGSLNPERVEWLMGWLIGWTALGASATDKCPSAPRPPSESSSESLNQHQTPES